MSRQVPRVRVGAYFALEATRTNKTNKHDWQHNAQAARARRRTVDNEIRTGASYYHANREVPHASAVWCGLHRICAELYLPTSVQGLLARPISGLAHTWRRQMHSLIYLVGLIVVVLLILSFLGLR